MKINVAKTAGFCFGVNRAVQTVYDLLEQKKHVYTLGPIIHNNRMIEELHSKGVQIINSIDEAPDGATVVIRAHGVPENIIEILNSKKIDYVDATCPFVSKIHAIVKKASEDHQTVFIFGNRDHPEVIGIRGHCKDVVVFGDFDEFERYTEENPERYNDPITVVVQTTYNIQEFEKCLKILKRVYTNSTIFDTICNATVNRQMEAISLAKESELMIIIGARHSSNTVKLFDVCRNLCETYLIESAEELPVERIRACNNISITAGASTPAAIIKEVLDIMSVEKNEELHEENFAELLEESFKSFDTNDRVHGVVVSVNQSEVQVDINRKQAGYIPANELSSDPNAKPEDIVKVGDELDLLIMRTNDQEGTIMLSKKRLDAQKGWEVIEKAKDEEAVVEGVVTEVIKGGVIAVTNGVRVFIPASQATATRGEPLDDLVKKDVKFRIIEVNRQRRRAVGSIRSVLRDEKKALAEKFWETAEEGKEYEGVVKSITNYGAFVDLGGIDGMIHISELSWSRIKNPTEVVNVGDVVKVYIKKLDRENNKISLGYKRDEDNPWNILKEQYPVGTVVDAVVVGMTSFGAFARIIPGIDGLIHISQIANERIEKPQDVLKVDDVVKAKITDIDFEKKRVSLSIRALLPKENEEAQTEE